MTRFTFASGVGSPVAPSRLTIDICAGQRRHGRAKVQRPGEPVPRAPRGRAEIGPTMIPARLTTHGCGSSPTNCRALHSAAAAPVAGAGPQRWSTRPPPTRPRHTDAGNVLTAAGHKFPAILTGAPYWGHCDASAHPASWPWPTPSTSPKSTYNSSKPAAPAGSK